MEVRPQAIREDAMKTINQINAVMDDVKREAAAIGTDPWMLRASDGSWMMAPLLHAKALCLNTLALLHASKPR